MSLLLLLRSKVAPVASVPSSIDEKPKYSLVINTPDGGVRLERTIVDTHTSGLGVATKTAWKTPLDAPGLRACVIDGIPRRGPYSFPFTMTRNKKVIEYGFISDHDPNWETGFAEMQGISIFAALQNEVVGGTLENLLGEGMGGYTAINCKVSSGDSVSFGSGVTLTEGPDKISFYRSIHKNVNVSLSNENQTFYSSVWARLNRKGKYPPQVLIARYDPNKTARDPTRITALYTADLPVPMSPGKWYFVEMPNVTILRGATNDQVRVGFWAPKGGGSVTYCGARMVGDPGLSVPKGASSAHMVAALINHGRDLMGIDVTAIVTSASARIFKEGFTYHYIDHANIWSSVQSYAAEVDLLWQPDRRTILVGRVGSFGIQHTNVVFSARGRGSGRILSTKGPSDGMITRTITQSPYGSNSREEVETGAGAPEMQWRDVIQAYDETYPIDLPAQGQAHDDQLSDVAKTLDQFSIGVPPDGTSPGDWIDDGPGRQALVPGDYVATQKNVTVYRNSRFARVASITVTPSNGDAISGDLVGID